MKLVGALHTQRTTADEESAAVAAATRACGRRRFDGVVGTSLECCDMSLWQPALVPRPVARDEGRSMRTKGPSVKGTSAQWSKMLDWAAPELFRGTVFRCLEASWPYESGVDFMLVELLDSPSGLAVIVATGYKAGLVLVHLPVEATAGEGARALSTKWVVENWAKWIYPACPIESVRVIGNYPAGFRIEDAPPSPSRDLEIGS